MKMILFKTKFAVLTIALLISAQYAGAETADFETRETVIHVTHNTLKVELNEKTVICSRADYSMPMLKVLIPGLSDVTLLNHQNTGAGAPCVTTGELCQSVATAGTSAPSDILQGRHAVEPIEVVVKATRVDLINHKDKTCTVNLRENVESVIRGKRLFHERESEVVPRSYEDCVNGGGKVAITE